MSDADIGSVAWRLPPSEYLARRERDFTVPSAPASQYIAMRDGCKIAIDVFLPQTEIDAHADRQFPAIVVFTPYYRRFKVAEGSKQECSPNTFKYRDQFVPYGYAVVVVDVRGTGASFGSRDSFRSPAERADTVQVVDWIIAQSWSNGRVGATGVSYLGASSDFLASTGHPAVKAIAPLFSVWDTYRDNYYPGGIQVKSLTRLYDDIMIGLDHDRRDVLRQFAYFNHPDFQGPQPVDEDHNGEMCAAAIQEHLANFRQTDFMAEFKFSDDCLPYDKNFTPATFSPHSYCAGTRSDLAIYSVSGWMDGTGYMNGAISRFLTLSENPKHLLLGPWDHGARINVSPWRLEETAQFGLMPELLRFFDHYLQQRPTGLDQEAPIHYFSMHDEQWCAAEQWPPTEIDSVLFLGNNQKLSAEPPQEGAKDEYQVDFRHGSGNGTRYERIAGVDSRIYYADWQGRTKDLLSYTTASLPDGLDICGHIVADFWVESNQPDAALFVYVSEIESDGTERYVTEGLLRALLRKETTPPATYRTTWPYQSLARKDAQVMHPGTAEHIRLALTPTAWAFKPGSKIRVSFAGADSDHCGQIPHGRPPRLKILRGGSHPSKIIVPSR
ncbi:CocE/NonD family hydrolase [Pseudomonas wayambapalatensis]|uniref:CocE/NonD family hydrolase n=1 Tax=unclassified Pseudomonas TaxID=196821 RepID=UPI001647FACB|nr:CocE/NonD family hydrolase [Pseudomonas sp. RW3S2]MBC3421423.1 CocE/NonD family hydrolase [Pseudomonas sp. RW3S2]QXI45332.1 CocE/NonD family hydrolase [Pseudomonas wayambapalatensis]